MTAIYHITHIHNLSLILEHGGLLCHASRAELNLSHVNISHQTIQDRRATTRVPLAPYGTLHDYVPFYFAPRSPMLYSIHRGNVEGYTDGQTPILHVVLSAEHIAQKKLPFVFTDGHAIISFSNFYNDLKELNQIDWQVMKSRYWRDTLEDNDRKRRRSAEFLVHRAVPWELVQEIGVINHQVATAVEQILAPFASHPLVTVHREWYYD
jgi:hypothetical protein